MGNGILVLCEHEGGRFKKTAFELLGKAVELAAELGGPVSALVLGDADPAELGAWGAARVYVARGLAFENDGVRVSALQAAVEAAGPDWVLAPASLQAKAALPRLAARLGLGLATEATELRTEGGELVARRPMYAGKVFADVRFSARPGLVTVRPNSFPVPAKGSGAAEVVELSVQPRPGDEAARVVDREEAPSAVVDLTEADRIVSGGRALRSKENFDAIIRPLAAALGATPGASRAAVDAGYAPHSEQVGQTGKVVNPSLYIACGISGAIQHLAGMRTSRIIVAINTDPEAPIFQHATYGIVADLFEVCPKLTEAFKKALAS